MNKQQQALGRIGVLFGGMSAERQVSLKSGQAVLRALFKQGIEAVAIDLQGQAVAQLVESGIDTAFIALHGGIGEDGRLQALLDMMGIRYTGSGMQACALAMNKLISKQLWQGVGIPTAPFALLDAETDFDAVIKALGGDVVVKPAHEGSSLGVALADSAASLRLAYEEATQYGTEVLAEQRLLGAEYTVAVLNGRALPGIELQTDHSFYDYDAKYIDQGTRYLCPCGLSVEQEQQLQTLAMEAFDSLGCLGWGRVDIMKDAQGQFHVLEVNTVPGLTDHSLVPMAAKATGYDFDALVVEILQTACNGQGQSTD